MTAKTYQQLFKSNNGPAGAQEMGVRVFDVSSGDTIEFSGDFTRVDRAAFMSRSRAVPSVSLIASTAIASRTLFTFPTSPSLQADDVDLLLLGPQRPS